MYDQLKLAIQYIRNTGETATVDQFDEDHEPVGWLLRKEIVPSYATIVDGVLKLTDQGRSALGEPDGQ